MNIPVLALRGNIKTAFESREPTIGLDGPAGTGKSVGLLGKLHARADKYPGSRHLITRLTRISITQTAMITLENNVYHPEWKKRIRWRTDDQAYHYPNGAIIAVGGLDQPTKIMSSEWDTIYVQEAIEMTEDRFDALSTRLRYGATPYHQMLFDTNPGPASHWLKRNADAGQFRMLPTRHEDNPRYWDAANCQWTSVGIDYIARLDKLSGVRKDRLRYGRWVSAEGMIYETFDRAVHVIDPLPVIPAEWPRYLAIDFGYRNPLVIQWWAESPDGILYLYREYYHTGVLVEDAARAAVALSRNEPPPRAVICDHDAEDRATFEKHSGWSTTAAYKDVTNGIQAMQARLRVGGNGKAGLYVFSNALMVRDPARDAAKQPCGFIEEIDGYIWDTGNGKKTGETPLKQDDHSCLAAGTLVQTDEGYIPIEQVRVGMRVATRQGYKPVLAAGMTNASAKVKEVVLSNGNTLIGTGNHPVYVTDRGFIPIDALRYNDIIWVWKKKQLFLTAYALIGIRTQKRGRIAAISRRTARIGAKAWGVYTKKFGRPRTVLFPKVATFTTATMTPLTMPPTIWNALQEQSIMLTMGRITEGNRDLDKRFIWQKPAKLRRNGILPIWVGNGIGNMLPRRTKSARLLRENAKSAKSHSSLFRAMRKTVFVQMLADLNIAAGQVKTMFRKYVPIATQRGWRINIGSKPTAPVHVLSVRDLPQPQPVYNLTIADVPEYYANGILVHNCDAARYAVAYFDRHILPTISVGPDAAPVPADTTQTFLKRLNLAHGTTV